MLTISMKINREERQEEDAHSIPFRSLLTQPQSKLEHMKHRKKWTVFFLNSGYISPNIITVIPYMI